MKHSCVGGGDEDGGGVRSEDRDVDGRVVRVGVEKGRAEVVAKREAGMRAYIFWRGFK